MVTLHRELNDRITHYLIESSPIRVFILSFFHEQDPNDLPLVEEIRAAIDDIVISLQFVDGKVSASKLSKVVEPEGGWVASLYEEQVRKNQPVFPIRKNKERLFNSSNNRRADYNSVDETDSLL